MENLTTQAEPTLRETLEAAVEQHTEPVTPPELTTTQPDQDGSAAVVTEPDKPGRTANRLRDDNGRLLPGTKPATEPAKSDPPPQTAPAAVAPKRPSTWKKDYWTDWDALAQQNPKLAAYLEQRESEFAKGVSTYKQEWDNARPLIDAVTPFLSDLQKHNIAPAQWIGELGNAHRSLAMGSPQEQMATVQSILRNNNIQAQLAVQDAQGQWQLLAPQQAPQRPQPQAQTPDIEKLFEQKWAEKETSLQIQQFKETKDATGNPAHPHFEAVKETMSGLLQSGLADDLTSAYAAALALPKHSDLAQADAEQRRAADETRRAEEARQVVTRARAKSTSVRGATPTASNASEGKKDLRGQLSEAFDAHVNGGRV